jgi:hypothetical protein
MAKKFDKYSYYTRAVQSPETDMEFVDSVYRELRGHRASTLREDFCGTFANCCAWVRLHSKNRAYGLDLDPEPIRYGRKNHLVKLTEDQQQRVEITQGDVLHAPTPRVDVVSAFNFSYFTFKDQKRMLEYFKQARSALNPSGLFMIDCFGGSESQTAIVENTKHKDFIYYWEQADFNPIDYHAKFYIHFYLRKERKKMNKVFRYDWRLWTIPELRQLLSDAGFERSYVYWEGTTASGTGDGKFKRTEMGEACEGWIAYIVAVR